MMESQTSVDVDTDLIALAMHKLSIDNTNVTDILTDCNIYLNKLNRFDLAKSANLMDLNLMFDCLNTIEQKQIDMSCSLLQKLLLVLPPSYIFEKYSVSIERSLHHPNDVVKPSILSVLDKLLIIDRNVEIPIDLLCTIVDCLTSSDMSTSCNAVKCLKQLQSIECLLSPLILAKLQSILAMDAKLRTRVYDVLIHWAKSVDALALVTSKGLFSNLVSDITYPDAIMQMVTIEMLIPLSITEHGFDYLNSVGIISGLYRLLSSSPKELNSSLSVILNPIVLEFFIEITKVRPQLIFTTYPKVFVVLYDVLREGEDDSLVGVVIKSIISLASSWDCKTALDIPSTNILCGYQGDKELDIWSILIIELSHIASSTKTELKTGAIQAITKIIQIEDGKFSSKNYMFERTQKWYKLMNNNPIKNIVHASCIVPFLDVQQAGFEMLRVLAEQPWGQEEISKDPLLLDIILKNCPTDSLVIKNLKEIIIEALVVSDIFRNNIMSHVKNNDVNRLNTNSPQPEVSVEDMIM